MASRWTIVRPLPLVQVHERDGVPEIGVARDSATASVFRVSWMAADDDHPKRRLGARSSEGRDSAAPKQKGSAGQGRLRRVRHGVTSGSVL